MKTVFLILIFFSLQSKATEIIQFENTWNLFSQKLGPTFTLPEPLSNRVPIIIQFELPPSSTGNTLKKVYSQTFEIKEFKAVFEIYFFEQNAQKYFSQQIYLYKEANLVTRCTSYFGLEQKFLVPGSCAGVVDGVLYGVAVYK